MEKLRMAIIGSGQIAQVTHIPNYQLMGNVAVSYTHLDVYKRQASDLARMSNDFRAEVEKSAASKGGSLVISEEGRKIENGFVLAYGGIEENCTLQAIFDAKKDELSDKVHRIIFA